MDIVRRIFSGWVILAVCVVIGLLVSHFILVPKQQALLAMRALPSEEFAEKCKENLTEDQVNTVMNTLETKRLLAETDDYLQNAIMMLVDPYNINTLVVNFNIQEETGQSWTIAQEYVNRVGRGETLELIGNELGWDTGKGYYANIITAGVVDGNNFTYTVSYTDEDTLHKISAALQKIVAPSISRVSDLYYTIEMTDEAYSVRSDPGHGSTQNAYQQWRASYNGQIENAKTSFLENEDQNNLFYCLAGEMDGADYSDNYIGRAKPPRSAKFLYAVGLAGGLILGVAVILVKILADVRLLAGSELYSLYNMPMLGSFRRKKGDVAIAKVVAACKEADVSKLALIGTALGGRKTSAAVQAIISALETAGVEAVFAGNLSKDAAAVTAAAEIKNVLAVETVGTSRYTDIEQEIVAINSCGLKLIGAVGVE